MSKLTQTKLKSIQIIKSTKKEISKNLKRCFIFSICALFFFILNIASASSLFEEQSQQTSKNLNQKTDRTILSTPNQNTSTKNVLILHSYHAGFYWTDRIIQGIASVLKNEDIELFVNYMDTKHCSNEDYLVQLKTIYKTKYDNTQFDAILTTDDHALNFLLKFGNELFPDVPVVFCGINDFHPIRIEGHNNFTGIYETYDVLGTVHLIKHLHPKVKTIALINDGTVSGKAFRNRVNRVENQLKDSIKFKYLSNLSIEELGNQLQKLPNNAAVIWGIYLRTPKGIVFTNKESIQQTSTFTQLPIYCIWDVVGQGVIGGKITNPNFQGEEAAKLIIRILNGERPSNIPVSGSPMVYKFDYNLLQQFNISETNIPKKSIVLNKPISFFKKYEKLIWPISSIITTLVLIVFVLIHLLQKIKTSEKKLLITNKKLEFALEKAEESDRLKTSFLANLSHEIRTPMNGIIGFSKLLDNKNITTIKQKKYLDLIKSSSQRMLELINNLVDISRIETEQIKCFQNKIDLNKLVLDTYSFFTSLAKDKNLKITCNNKLPEESCQIISDQQKLEQILYNLLSNAIKFTKSGKIILTSEIRWNQIYFSIKDTGPGIPTEMQEIIFERFRQADHTAFHAEQGSGLGLAISKSLVEIMGGEIGVHSELNKGAEFFFTIPYTQAR